MCPWEGSLASPWEFELSPWGCGEGMCQWTGAAARAAPLPLWAKGTSVLTPRPSKCCPLWLPPWATSSQKPSIPFSLPHSADSSHTLIGRVLQRRGSAVREGFPEEGEHESMNQGPESSQHSFRNPVSSRTLRFEFLLTRTVTTPVPHVGLTHSVQGRKG